MSQRRRLAPTPTSAFAVAFAAIAAAVVWHASTTGDYVTHGATAGDNPAPAIDALMHGRLGAYAAHQPLMGLVSLVIRVPFVEAAHLLGGGELFSYRLGAFGCLLAFVLLAASLVGEARPHLRTLASAALAVVIVLAGSPMAQALSSGHPEEVLASVLATAAVLAALNGRCRVAGIMLGLAIGTKQWAIITIVPVLAALPGGRFRALAVTGGVAALAILPAVLANPAAFARAGDQVGGTHFVNQLSAWWLAGSSLAVGTPGAMLPVHVLPLGLSRGSAGGLLVVLIFLVSACLALAHYRLQRRSDALALLALVMLVRCLGDPLPLEYYFVPVVVAVAAWETSACHRPPLLAALVTGVLALTTATLVLPSALQNVFALCWMLSVCAYLCRAIRLVRRPRTEWTSRRDVAPALELASSGADQNPMIRI